MNQSFLESLNAETEQTWLTDLISPKSALLEIPQKYLASYIGITPQALSRIRAKLPQQI